MKNYAPYHGNVDFLLVVQVGSQTIVQTLDVMARVRGADSSAVVGCGEEEGATAEAGRMAMGSATAAAAGGTACGLDIPTPMPPLVPTPMPPRAGDEGRVQAAAGGGLRTAGSVIGEVRNTTPCNRSHLSCRGWLSLPVLCPEELFIFQPVIPY